MTNEFHQNLGHSIHKFTVTKISNPRNTDGQNLKPFFYKFLFSSDSICSSERVLLERKLVTLAKKFSEKILHGKGKNNLII